MNYDGFLQRVIDDGIAAARADYVAPEQARLLAGSIDGFEACRGKTPAELVQLYISVPPVYRQARRRARRWRQRRNSCHESIDQHWYCRGFQNEVEWVMNVVSALLQHEGRPPLLAWLPTARGYLKAAEIAGVAEVTS